MEITKEAEKYIRNLARCRTKYENYLSSKVIILKYGFPLVYKVDLLLENTMVEIEGLLAELQINWKDYSGKLE